MENKREEILSEINSDIQAIRTRLAGLEEKFALLRDELGGGLADGQVFDLDVDTDVLATDARNEEITDIPENVYDAVCPEQDVDTGTVMETNAGIVATEVETPAVEENCAGDTVQDIIDVEFGQTACEAVEESGNVFFRDEIFEPAAGPAKIVNDAAGVVPGVIDNMMVKQAWRTDMAGSHVNDVRSAISLNDRVLFINSLCHENAVEFTELVAEINKCLSFDEALEYISSTHPWWNYDSDVVYRFMMAVRRKFN